MSVPHASLPDSPLSPGSSYRRAGRAGLVARLREAGCVFAEDEAGLLLSAARTDEELADMAGRRAAGYPLEHVLGWAEFCGMRMAVEPGVFVPRRRSEFLVREAAAGTPAEAVIVDLCCGSGALGAALAEVVRERSRRAGGGVELHAADVDPAAVRCARRNVAAAGGRVYEGDLFGALPAGLRGRIDVLLANVPYVPSSSVPLLPLEARVHEPRVALDGGADGLGVLRRVAAQAPEWLAPGGRLLVETGADQAEAAVAVLAECGLTARSAHCEELGATVVTGTRGGA